MEVVSCLLRFKPLDKRTERGRVGQFGAPDTGKKVPTEGGN